MKHYTATQIRALYVLSTTTGQHPAPEASFVEHRGGFTTRGTPRLIEVAGDVWLRVGRDYGPGLSRYRELGGGTAP